ncbi:MAG: hypothetical protein Q9157_009125, partial [Trypethelium eluteriae]
MASTSKAWVFDCPGQKTSIHILNLSAIQKAMWTVYGTDQMVMAKMAKNGTTATGSFRPRIHSHSHAPRDAWKAQSGISRTEAKRRYISTLIETMHKYAAQAPDARELVSELEFVWDQIKSN